MSFISPMTTYPDIQAHSTPPTRQPVYDARRMVGDESTASITLDEKTYTLRITRAGKLILTK